MYISRLQLRGFKSFGGQHDLILSPGFTAIVGPNGSGKSNILDALRWSLGDSNAGRLRISRQSDLLFQGSVSMPAAKEADVLLSLRDEERTCTIKRRVLAPDGVTVLFVDNARKTITELDEIKRSWQLSGDKFAFIGQGEVAEVIQQRPAARRVRLETLFGIDVYRKRRMEASDRLVTVKGEYERLHGITLELRSRKDEIAPEVKRAFEMRLIVSAMSEDRKLLYWLRRASLEDIAQSLEDEAYSLSEKKRSLSAWAMMWKKLFDSEESELATFGTKRQSQTRELEQIKSQYETLAKSGVANAVSFRSISSRITQAKEERRKAKERFDSLLDEQSKASEESVKAKAVFDTAKKAYDESLKKWQEFNAKLEEEKNMREALNREKGNLEAEREQVKAKLSFLGKELLELRSPKNKSVDIDKELDQEIAELSKKRDNLLLEQEEAVKRHLAVYAKVQSIASELQRARREAASAKAKLNDAEDAIQAEFYPRPVQHLLSASKLGRLDAAPRAVIDVFSCSVTLSTALEAYLGGRQFQLLVLDMEEAERCIDRLKVNSVGRATFLPLERCRPRFPDKAFRLPSSGIVGWAIDLLKVEDKWLPAIQQIMGDLLITESYAVGQSIVRAGFKCPIVTMEGDVFQPGGTVSGGRMQKSGKTLEMKSQIAALKQEAKNSALRSESLSAEFKKAENDELVLGEDKEKYMKQIREFDGKIALIQDQKDSYAKEQKRAESEKAQIQRLIKEEGVRFSKLTCSLAELEEKWNEEITFEDDSKLIEDRERLKGEAALAAECLRSNFAMMERMSSEIRAEEKKVRELDDEILRLDDGRIKERSNLARVGKESLKLHNRRKEILAELESYAADFLKLEKKKEYSHKRYEYASLCLEQADAKYTKAENKKQETRRELEELINTWEEQYPYCEKGDLPCDISINELRDRIRDGERKIRSFGQVNMGVLSEDESLAERLGFFDRELGDVKVSALELERMIKDADKQAHKVFKDALFEVDNRFCELFQRLFGGGEAHLEITEGETIWDSGVDVVARPPGKHPKGMQQLSGGEQALTAISFLFASMEVAGCPIAVLDEVDAALDEVNLRRFSELAKEYAKNRQILAMTHRRVTMERADVLYGVTLSEQGLSQVIGVKLEDWS